MKRPSLPFLFVAAGTALAAYTVYDYKSSQPTDFTALSNEALVAAVEAAEKEANVHIRETDRLLASQQNGGDVTKTAIFDEAGLIKASALDLARAAGEACARVKDGRMAFETKIATSWRQKDYCDEKPWVAGAIGNIADRVQKAMAPQPQ